MTLLQKRKKVKELVETADERLLNEIIELAEKESKKKIGYSVTGEALTKGELLQIVNEAEVRYHKKEYVTQNAALNRFSKK
jgi:hypothetical protein